MTISRRLALGWASALAFTGGTAQLSLASVLKSAAKNASSALAHRHGRPQQTAQRFLELLIHRDEANHTPYSGEISIAASDTAWYAVDTLDSMTYRFSNAYYKKRGYRLRRVSAYKTKDGVRYSAIWELASGPEWHSVHGIDRAAFERKTADYARKGFRLAYVDVRQNYAAIWEVGDPGTQQVFSGLTTDEFQQQHASLAPQGYRPVRISGRTEGGASRFAVIFEKDSGVPWQAKHQMNYAEFHSTCAAMKAQGYRMTDASGHIANKKPVFSGIWEMA